MYAFRCKNCGKLHEAEHAGECKQPHACRVCGNGVVFTPDKDKALAALHEKYGKEQWYESTQPLPGFHKIIDHNNWEVLVDATDERLKELGLSKDMVEKHTPGNSGIKSETPQMIDAQVEEKPTVQDSPKVS